jgi:hypothetical protein
MRCRGLRGRCLEELESRKSRDERRRPANQSACGRDEWETGERGAGEAVVEGADCAVRGVSGIRGAVLYRDLAKVSGLTKAGASSQIYRWAEAGCS